MTGGRARCPWRQPAEAPRIFDAADPPDRRHRVNENDHPKGALLFMLVYLALLAFMWTNLYLKLWTR